MALAKHLSATEPLSKQMAVRRPDPFGYTLHFGPALADGSSRHVWAIHLLVGNVGT